METKALLKSKISFLGITKTDPIYITIRNGEITIAHVTLRQASDIIHEEGLIKASPIDFLDYYDPKNGSIYTDGLFQTIVNNDITLKKFLIHALDED